MKYKLKKTWRLLIDTYFEDSKQLDSNLTESGFSV